MPKNIYMVGIGGIGMSALAQLLAHRGHQVSGSDRDESPTTMLLADSGVTVWVGQKEVNIQDGCQLLIYSDAVPSSNAERAAGKEKGIPEMSYFEALGVISGGMRTIAVAGTHGKTTTTGMLTKILQHAGKNPSAVVGSIVKDFGSNFVAGSDEILVVEACEYRDHLLKLTPQILVITNIELDHTDYFPTLDALKETFRLAASRVPRSGCVIADLNDHNTKSALEGLEVRVYDYAGHDVPPLQVPGEFNRMNARAAKAATQAAFPDVAANLIDEALARFSGSWRRFEYKGETPSGAQVFDDYAHHPTAIRKTLEAVREKFPDKRVVVAFHPHLYSRTKSFLQEFADALANADEALIAPIYAAREEQDPGVSSERLAAAAREAGGRAAAYPSFDDIRDKLLSFGANTLIITMGAGDIYKVAEQIAD